MAELPTFRQGMAWRVDHRGVERVVWPSSEAEVAGAIAAREQAVDDQEAIERVRRMLRGERLVVGPGPQPRPPTPKPLPIKVSNRCEYKRDGVRCARKGSMSHLGEYRCPTHRFV